jgi:hypothetical protein
MGRSGQSGAAFLRLNPVGRRGALKVHFALALRFDELSHVATSFSPFSCFFGSAKKYH